ncbi:hypothetical protein [Methylobacterium pseudosasicola]|uniref:hypothetical protein n=1 Tax=Methylobacterium pseudosasicola TaxID=582667 RepID=UPI0011137ECD|nr:hypothetical protein [Methylobacterium pseudosasicola]
MDDRLRGRLAAQSRSNRRMHRGASEATRVVQKAGLSFSDLSALLKTLYGSMHADQGDGEPGSDHAAASGITTITE